MFFFVKRFSKFAELLKKLFRTKVKSQQEKSRNPQENTKPQKKLCLSLPYSYVFKKFF